MGVRGGGVRYGCGRDRGEDEWRGEREIERRRSGERVRERDTVRGLERKRDEMHMELTQLIQ